MSDTVTIVVDGTEIEVPRNITVLQACEMAGAEIPRFCFHERLSIAGNCRMCLVEAVGAPKPIASCAYGVRDLRPGRDGSPPVVNTRSEVVKKAREGVMEFLLINHPLDCPICDQGGECDLQDQSMAYGIDHTRFYENKRAVEDKYMGPLIKTVMTRCIHCTRCVRFATEVGGVPELGATGRGEDMEITTYLEHAVRTELSGNVIDLCPVGALTSKPYAFKARSWELRKVESIDVMDAVGSNIRVDYRGREVMRFLPRLHEDINEEWIADKTRFVWDGLHRQRLDTPYVRVNGALKPASWGEALEAVATRVKAADPTRIAALSGDLACTESQFALRQLLDSLGVRSRDCRQDGAFLPVTGPRQRYLFNTSIAGIEQADALLIVGANPRVEAPMLNARLRKRYLQRGFKGVGVIGEAVDLSFGCDHLGNGPQTLRDVLSGDHPFRRVLDEAERPMIVIGQGALARPDGASIYALGAALARETGMLRDADDDEPGWNGFNVLHLAAGRVGGLDVGFLPDAGGLDRTGIMSAAMDGRLDTVFLLGVDEIDMDALGSSFVVYQGSHGDAGAHRADVIFPGAAYTEKDALWVNTEGRVQLGKRAVFPPGEAREDWAIIRALSAALGKPLPYDTLASLRTVLWKEVPALSSIDYVAGHGGTAPDLLDGLADLGAIDGEPLRSPILNYYMTNPIARASETMAKCSAEILEAPAVQAAE
ncbi:MAG: NADH-quinone oxidoreductase subunit NuoG [Alphaproteobacteria bacterium]